ncbi:MAG: hypothetical protein SGPRY_013403, partial [Prymnesium sp.]
ATYIKQQEELQKAETEAATLLKELEELEQAQLEEQARVEGEAGLEWEDAELKDEDEVGLDGSEEMLEEEVEDKDLSEPRPSNDGMYTAADGVDGVVARMDQLKLRSNDSEQ